MRSFLRISAFIRAMTLVPVTGALGLEPGDAGRITAETAAPTMARTIARGLIASSTDAKPGKAVIRGLAMTEEEKARKMISFQLQNLEANGVTMARADDAAFFLERGIRDTGFDAAKVRWEITSANEVVLTVDEGDLLYLGDLKVEGNGNLSDPAVRELLTKVTRERLGYRIDAKEIPFVADDVNEGVKGIHHFYTLMGFTQAKVELISTDRPTGSDHVNISLSVQEGALHRVGDISFPEALNASLENVYAEVTTEFSEKPFTEAVTANLIDQITTAAKESGYYDAAVTVKSATPRKGSPDNNGTPRLYIDLEVRADWGEVYLLDSVEIAGIEKIQEGVIEQRFKHLLGEPYSPTATSKTVEKLLATGAFEALLVESSPNSDSTLSLTIEAQEAKRKRLGVYGGFGTYEGAILGLEFRNSSFLNRLHALEAEIEYTSRGLRGDIEYSNPWLFGSEWMFVAGMSSKTQENEGYTVWDTGLRFGLRRIFGRDEKHRIGLYFKPGYGDITDFDIEEQYLGPTDYFASVAGLIYSFGRTHDNLLATTGFSADLILSGASSAIGSEVEFGRAALRTSYHHPIGKTTLRLGARLGIIKPSDDEDLPIDLRFFSGGATSVRSFRERDLGPDDRNGYPIGGEFSSVFNIEYEIPVAGPLSIAPFVDAGNLILRAEDASLDNMHYAGGLGLIINSPIGPLRIDYGHNLNQGEGEPSGSWHVGFGFAF